MTKWNQILFEEAVINLYGNQFSFELSIFTTMVNTVTITCKDHGPFNIVSRNLLNGSTCSGCRNSVKLYTDSQLLELIHKRPNHQEFIYDLNQIRSMNSKITLVCKKEGHVNEPVTFKDHLRTVKGCKECSYKQTKAYAKSIKELTYGVVDLHDAQKRYPDVSFIDYKSASDFRTPCLFCLKEYPCNLKRLKKMDGKYHCKDCAMANMEIGYDVTTKRYTDVYKDIHPYSNLYVLVLQSEKETYYKIGISTDVTRRVRDISSSAKHYYSVSVLFSVRLPIDDTCKLENDLHSIFREYKVKPVVKFSGSSNECFSNIDGILDHIPFDKVEIITDLLSQQEMAA